jgi:hypothetical protein
VEYKIGDRVQYGTDWYIVAGITATQYCLEPEDDAGDPVAGLANRIFVDKKDLK